MAMTAISPCPPQLRARFAQIVGSDNLRDDEASLRLVSEDIWAASEHIAALIVAPETTEQLAAVIALAHEAGLPIAPRGAGMGYTSSYVPAAPNTVSIDTTRMNKVLAISAEDEP